MNPTKIIRLTLGNPEKITPSSIAPPTAYPVTEGRKEDFPGLTCSVSRRGVLIRFPLEGNPAFYGFGLQLKAFDHRGNKIVTRVNADPRSPSGDSHAPVPFFVTDQGWGLYVDSARNVTFQCGSARKDAVMEEDTGENRVMNGTEELYAVRSVTSSVMTVEIPVAEGIDLYFFKGGNVGQIVAAYNMFSGGGCMPPLWGLGNFYRCCGQFNEDQVRAIADEFREKDLPCDILGLEPGWQSHSYSCSYVWSDRFPHHKELLTDLAGKGFRVNLWEHAFVNPASPIHDDIASYAGDYLVWNGYVPDLSLSKARDIFSVYHKKLIAEGVSGFKLDECDGSDFTGGWSFPDASVFPSGMDGEQYHHLFGMLYCRTMKEALGEQRTLSEVRNLGALAASYPFVLYSDLYDFNDFLTGTVNAGFSGLLWAPELRHAADKNDLLRRLQLTCFSAQCLINAWYLDRMPWNDLNAVDEVREILRQRMQFIPYLYTCYYDYHTEGKPPVRALICDYPDAGAIRDEYLFGDLLVAPIAPGMNERTVWLPEGEWYDYYTGRKCADRCFTVSSDKIPLYVPAGTLLPLAKPLSHTGEGRMEIILHPFGDCGRSVCRLIEDDGLTDGTSYRVIVLHEGEEYESERYLVKG